MGTELTVSTEQLNSLAERIRALSEKTRTAKADAIGAMKQALELLHEEGTLLMQAELELGAAFDSWVDGLADHGVDPMQARYAMKVAKKHKDVRSLFGNPSAAKQLVLQNFAPAVPPKPETEGSASVAPYSISVRFNVDPLDPSFPKAKWLSDPLVKSVIQATQDLEG